MNREVVRDVFAWFVPHHTHNFPFVEKISTPSMLCPNVGECLWGKQNPRTLHWIFNQVFEMLQEAHNSSQWALTSFPLAFSVDKCIQKGFMDLSQESSSEIRSWCNGRSGTTRIFLYSPTTAASHLMLASAIPAKTESRNIGIDLRELLTNLRVALILVSGLEWELLYQPGHDTQLLARPGLVLTFNVSVHHILRM